jgi:hypothetical protein
MRSRNKVLSSEVKTLRSQMTTLVEKGRHDDELIDALMVCRGGRAEPPQTCFLYRRPECLREMAMTLVPVTLGSPKEMWVREGVPLGSKQTAGQACLCGHSLMVQV